MEAAGRRRVGGADAGAAGAAASAARGRCAAVRLLRRIGFGGEARVLDDAAVVALATLWFLFAAVRIAAAAVCQRCGRMHFRCVFVG